MSDPGVQPPRRGPTTAALLLAAIALSLLLAEGVVRLLPATTLGFVYGPGRFQKPPEFTRDRTRNTLGFHDAEPAAPVPGVRRLLLLGDSYVEAGSVPLEQTVGRRLAHHLGDAWQVIALGRSGWSQRQQLAALRQHGPPLAPDLVLTLFLSLNDVRESSDALNEAARAQQGLALLRPGWPQLRGEAAPLFLLRRSRLNQLVSYRLALWLARRDSGSRPASIPLDYLAYATEPGPRWREAWGTAERLLESTHLASQALGAGYAIVSASTPQGVLGSDAGLALLRASYPAMRDRAFDLDLPDRRLERFATARNLPFLALEPAFRDATARGERLHWRFDGHWNPEGNDRAAVHIADFVRGLDPP